VRREVAKLRLLLQQYAVMCPAAQLFASDQAGRTARRVTAWMQPQPARVQRLLPGVARTRRAVSVDLAAVGLQWGFHLDSPNFSIVHLLATLVLLQLRTCACAHMHAHTHTHTHTHTRTQARTHIHTCTAYID
jgi:hypothetical protein